MISCNSSLLVHSPLYLLYYCLTFSKTSWDGWGPDWVLVLPRVTLSFLAWGGACTLQGHQIALLYKGGFTNKQAMLHWAPRLYYEAICMGTNLVLGLRVQLYNPIAKSGLYVRISTKGARHIQRRSYPITYQDGVLAPTKKQLYSIISAGW